MYAYDIETKSSNGMLYPICVCFGCTDNIRTFYSENCVAESIEYIMSLGRSLNIYVHNLDFDGYIILGNLLSFYNYGAILLIDKRLYMIRVKMPNKVIVE
jgi:hypothetical protein